MTTISAEFLRKARRSIRSAELLVHDGDFEFAANRAYYAMLYAAKALLDLKHISTRTHRGVQHSLWEHFVAPGLLDKKFHHWLIDAFDQRLQGDYDCVTVVGADDVIETLDQAREFLDAAERLLT